MLKYKVLNIILVLVLLVSCRRGELRSCQGDSVRVSVGGNVPSGSGTNQAGSTASGTLQARRGQGDITTTSSLVDALRDAQPTEQQALQQWIERYIDWFNKQAVGSLTPEAMQEYSLLAHIKADTKENKALLTKYFNNLCNKVSEAYQHGEEPLIKSLEYTLQNIDSNVFEGDPAPLIELGNRLLAKLNPTKTSFSQETYPTHRSKLYALHQVMVLIQQIASSKWSTQEESLYSRFREKIQTIAAASSAYYPIHYHALLLAQSLNALAKPPSRLQEGLRRVGQGLQGAIYLFQVARAISGLNFNMDDFKKGYDSLQEAFTQKEIKVAGWYDWHQAMNQASLSSLQDASQYADFEQGLLKAKNFSRSSQDPKQGYQALRFGIVTQLSLLARCGITAEMREESIKHLSTLAEPTVWGGKPEVMAGLLDELAAIFVHNTEEAEKQQAQIDKLAAIFVHNTEEAEKQQAQIDKLAAIAVHNTEAEKQQAQDKLAAIEAEKQQAQTALESLVSRPAVTHRDWRPHMHANNRKAAAAQTAIQKWLGNQELADKLANQLKAQSAPAASSDQETLFQKIQGLHPTTLAQTRQDLRDYYTRLDFAQVPSLLKGKSPKHVKSLHCQLNLFKPLKVNAGKSPHDSWSTHHEGRAWVKIPISLAELFKRRSTQPDEPEREIHRVLLVGEAGTGKTTLSHKLAYSWAQGKWGQEFQSVYVLPIRHLEKSYYDSVSFRREETLATAIANLCFSPPSEEERYKGLRYQISEELKKPTTLVVLDGLDERYGASESLLSQAKAGSHKLLLLSRPYEIEQERTLVDIEIAHTGFSDEQMEAYVKGDLTEEFSADLLAFIKKDPALASIAHVPVNLQILCALWQDRSLLGKEAEQVSLPGLYRRLTQYIWDRYTKKCHQTAEKQLYASNKEKLFRGLGKIALISLQQGKVLFSEALISEVLSEVLEAEPTFIAMLPNSGLLQPVGDQYQFPHLTFQEYFAGRGLAQQLVSNKQEDQDEVRNFLAKHKYAPQYVGVLSFLAGEVSNMSNKGVNGLSQLLAFLEEYPKEVGGVQHLLLQMRLLNEWLCVAGEDWEKNLASLEKRFSVMSSLQDWLLKGVERIRSEGDRELLDLLMTGLHSSRSVASHTMQVLKKQVLAPLLTACKDDNSEVRDAASFALRQVVQVDPESTKQVLAALLATCKDDDSGVRCTAHLALAELVKIAPTHTAQVLQSPLAIAACKNDSLVIRSIASQALLEAVKFAPAHAEQVLQPLLSLATCQDNASDVRCAASKALGELVQVAPAHAAKVLQPLLSLATCQDDDSEVRCTASESLVAVVQVAPTHAEQVLQPLLSLATCQDDASEVRDAASEALVAVIQVDPAHAEQVLQPLLSLATCKDEKAWVRSVALEALGSLVQAAPAHAPALVNSLIAACKDPKEEVQHAASESLVAVVQADPAHTVQVLECLLEVIRDEKDESEEACWVSNTVHKVVKAVPGHAPVVEFLLSLADCKDEKALVRRIALEALGLLVQAAPAHAPALVNSLIAACKDAKEEVQHAASESLVAVVKAAPAHTVQVLEHLLAVIRKEEYEDEEACWVSNTVCKIVKSVPVDTPAVESLIAVCQDANFVVRRVAVQALGEVVQTASEHDPALVKLLIDACQDANFVVRRVAVQALGEVVQTASEHDPALVNSLIAACKDEDEEVRRIAVQTLESVVQAVPEHAPALVEPLLAACKDAKEDVRMVAFEALGSLVKVAKDAEEKVRDAVLQALGEGVKAMPGHAPAVEPLLAACKDADEDKQALGEGGKFAPAHASVLVETLITACQDAKNKVRVAALKTLGEVVKFAPAHAPALVDPLLATYKNESSLARKAVSQALGKVAKATPKHAPALIDPLIALCGDKEAYVRRAALQALGSFFQVVPAQDPAHAPALVETLIAACKDAKNRVRMVAFQALGEVVKTAHAHAPALVEPLIDACKDADEDVRLDALQEALGPFFQAAPTYAPALVEPLIDACKDADEDVRLDALQEALGPFFQAAPTYAPALVEPLIDACKDADEDVRRAALKALMSVAQAGPKHATQALPLLGKAIRDTAYRVRSTALKALVEFVQTVPSHTTEVLELLLGAFKESEEEVRRDILKDLGPFVKAVPSHTTKVLGRLLGACKESKEARRDILKALGPFVKAVPRQHTPQVLERLLGACKESEEVRRDILQALRKFSLQQFIDVYWAMEDQAMENQALLPLIAAQLYQTLLLVQTSPKTDHLCLVLHPTAEQPVKWEKTKEEVQHFVTQLKSVANY